MPDLVEVERRRRSGAYQGERPDVQALVPPDARRVLDIGCSTGSLGAALKRRQEVEVVGLEIDTEYAAAASTRLDSVLTGDVAELVESWEHGSFDCVVAADVLEHLVDPWTVLRRVADLVEPGGAVVISVPNVRFFETFWQVGIRGTWPRRAHGLFDRTHLRWFTLRDAHGLAEQAGLQVVAARPSIRVRPRGSRFDRLFRWLGRTPLAPFFTAQYLLLCRRPP